MLIEIINYEPYVELIISNKWSGNLNCKCLIDTWFSWDIAIPYFKNNANSIVNNIDFIKNETYMLNSNNWTETASWESKTYRSVIEIIFSWELINSELLIFEHNLDYSKDRDCMIL